jgi:hypothetical protein
MDALLMPLPGASTEPYCNRSIDFDYNHIVLASRTCPADRFLAA